MKMKQQVVESGGGPDYDWANDHIYVKTTCDHADGRVTVVEDTLKPGFRLDILEGEVTFNFNDEPVVASRGITMRTLAEQYDTWMV